MNDRKAARVAHYSMNPFQPDVLVPIPDSQYQQAPEIRLMIRILEDAIFCFQRYRNAKDGPTRRSFREAHDWLMSDDKDWAFSFPSICEVLGLNPSYVRRGLQQWTPQTTPQRPGGVADGAP